MSETNLAKIAIAANADEALSRALEQVNKDFDGGRITKTDFASWLLLRAANSLDTSAIEEVRKAHFNQIAYLETLVKKLKSSNRDNLGPDELATLQSMLVQQSTKRRPRTTKQKEISPDNITQSKD